MKQKEYERCLEAGGGDHPRNCTSSLVAHRHVELSRQWLEDIKALTNKRKEVNMFDMQARLDPNVWSAFEYINPCVDETHANRLLHVPIEPLVGLLRNPFSMSPCVPEGAKGAPVLDRKYLLVNAMV